MSFASPQTVTIDAVAQVLPRINGPVNGVGVFVKKATGTEHRLTIRHSDEKAKLGAVVMERHNVDLMYTTYDEDGVPTVYQVYTVLRTPKGADPTIVEKMSVGLAAWLNSNDGAVIGWEA